MKNSFYYLCFSLLILTVSLHAQLKINTDGTTQFLSTLSGNQKGAVRISANGKYLDLGPKNASFAHFYTDAWAFYFNHTIAINGFLYS